MEENLPNHVDLVGMLDIADLDKGADVAGGRGYYLKGARVLLDQAMINYGVVFGGERTFSVSDAVLYEKDRMAECAQLADFDEQLYKVTEEGDDKYLIATSVNDVAVKKVVEREGFAYSFVWVFHLFQKRKLGVMGEILSGIFRVHRAKVEQFTWRKRKATLLGG